jgi:hypothetical protein
MAFLSAQPVLADPPGVWTMSGYPVGGVNVTGSIMNALTGGTPGLDDDEAGEFIHEIQVWPEWLGIPFTFPTVEAAFNWTRRNVTPPALPDLAYKTDQDNYGIDEAWANPEQTIARLGGDCEDLAFLLASVLRYHCDEVVEDDLVYAVCGFLLPPEEDFRTWVVWFDQSEKRWLQLDPCGGTSPIVLSLGDWEAEFFPSIGTLWLNEHHVLGCLPGYYPGDLDDVCGFARDDFGTIAARGFGEEMNNYVWSEALFDGDLYAGTGRNIPYRLLEALLQLLGAGDYEYQFITSPQGEPGSQEWAEDMTAEIWRLHEEEWNRVYKSEVVEGASGNWVPVQAGFRAMAVFDGALYASNGGSVLPGLAANYSSGALLLRSENGTSWQAMNTTPEMGPDSRAMVAHNGKLYLATGHNGSARVWASTDPTAGEGSWDKVADFTSCNGSSYNNTGVVSVASFNDRLYAGTQNLQTGFEVWRSNSATPALCDWTRVVDNGAGDGMNYWAGTMEQFNGRLYVASMSLPITPNPGIVAPKGFELIWISPDDSWETVIGGYIPRVPPPGGAVVRVPRSGWPSGFGNPFNLYCWSLKVHEDDGKDVLYLGTFDASSFLRFLPVEQIVHYPEFSGLFESLASNHSAVAMALGLAAENLEAIGVDPYYVEAFEQLQDEFATESVDWQAVWNIVTDYLSGADLWKTEDGIRWVPVSLNGMDNPDNYGFRNMVKGSLYIGTANPFQGGGCEVLKAPAPSGDPTDAGSDPKGEFLTTEAVYVIGRNFPPEGQVDVYVVPDRHWESGDDIPADVSSDGVNTLTADADGNLAIPAALVWPPPLAPGRYDIVFDVDQNGVFSFVVDAVNDPNDPGFVVRSGEAVGGEAEAVDRPGIVLRLGLLLATIPMSVACLIGLWRKIGRETP